MTAACLAVLPASSAFAGRLFATGHDLDLHCHFGAQCGYVDTAVRFVRGDAPDPTKPVLILERLDNDFSASLTNTFGAGTVPSVSMDPRSAAFATAPLNTSLYSAILIGSDITCGGCDLNEFDSTPDSDAINARTADIATFFNAGGGLLYGSGAEHGNGSDPDDVYYLSAPLPVGGVPVAPPFTLTAEGTALGLTDADANCCPTHNSFVDPPAGSSIIVAERDSAGTAETLFSEGTIVGGDIFALTLTPATGANPVGTSHTVTATLTNQDGVVANKSVRFTVSGVNPTSGSGTTNASGEATFSYTGTNAGTDTIAACADLDGDATCDPDEPTATAAKTWIGAKGRMGGKGSLNDTSTATPFAGTATFAYALACTKASNPITTRQNPLEVRFGGQRFTLSSVSSIGCSTTGAGTPSAGFDTMTGSASGVLRRANGSTVSATADFRFFDGGAGLNDRSRIVITASGAQVLLIDGAPAKFPGSSQPTGENIAAP